MRHNRPLFRFLVFSLLIISFNAYCDEVKEKSLYDMSFEELEKLSYSTSTLTQVEGKYSPSPRTIITADMIRVSGARSLSRLLEIYVPNFQYIISSGVGPLVGMGGLVSDLNDKILLLVNGKAMNNRMFYGADSEMMNSLLGDIAYIEVIRSPGSATLGPGALAGVINIVTFNSNTFEGFEVTARQGFLESFTSLQLKYAHKFDKDSGLFVYYGIDNYRGNEDTGVFASYPFMGTPADQEIKSYEHTNLYQAFRSKPRHKLHIQYDDDDTTVWLRYNEGGVFQPGSGPIHITYKPPSLKGDEVTVSVAYRQLALAAEETFELGDNFTGTLHLSGDIYQRVRDDDVLGDSIGRDTIINVREDKFLARWIMNWDDFDRYKFALGVEYAWQEFGRRPIGYPHESHTPSTSNGIWSTDMYSIFGEVQWIPRDDIRVFIGARLDDHTYRKELFSPRFSVVYELTPKDLFKLNITKSIRRTSDYFARNEYLNTGNEDSQDIEELTRVELTYRREHTENLSSELLMYHSNLDAIAWLGSSINNSSSGEMDLMGLELVMKYQTTNTQINLSHGIVKLIDFKLADPSITKQVFTAEPYGYGDDILTWSTHQTKLNIQHQLDENFKLYGSLIYYWGFDGAEDFSRYRSEVLGEVTASTGDDGAFQENIYLNLGLEYKSPAGWTVALNGHNLLGFIDEKYNKRNTFSRMDIYLTETPAVSVTFSYEF